MSVAVTFVTSVDADSVDVLIVVSADVDVVDEPITTTFGTDGPRRELRADLKCRRRSAVELTTPPSASLPLELHGLVGRAMAMATTALLVAHVVAIDACAWLTETVMSCSGLTVDSGTEKRESKQNV